MRDLTPVVIEVNPRLAGGMIPELVKLAHGVDMVRAQVAVALGMDTAISFEAAQYASIRFLTTTRSTTVWDLAPAIDAARAIRNVVDVTAYCHSGTLVEPAVDFHGRVGHVIALSDVGDEASSAAEVAIDRMKRTLRFG